VTFLTVVESSPPSMAKRLVLWLFYCIAAGFFSAGARSR